MFGNKSTRNYEQFKLVNSCLPIIEKYNAHIGLNCFDNFVIGFSSKYCEENKTHFNFILFDLQKENKIKVIILYGTKLHTKDMNRIEYYVQAENGKIDMEKFLFEALEKEKEYIQKNDPEYIDMYLILTRRFFL